MGYSGVKIESKSDFFLAEQEVDELTGIGRGRTERVGPQFVKMRKFELQARQLRTMGVPFFVNARGRPIIARAFFMGVKVETPLRPKWQPSVLTKDDA
ncbi:DUF4224 domain-containing protein [Ralstonia pseudosolanacearum]|uniref:DUF4224 domain-containing protein n=1 Tax=Ralstonia solanacearum species complex TaxID=3116862 RepID=UPI00036FCB21|nr:DUF4224 domain-containing protein [Ralstonia pseudosolanacearum]MCK4121078.1 DUF4224 domain-containing protein [Ralstonia pseudosolanacearum]